MAEATNPKSLQDIIDDNFYQLCKDRFLRQGKGRRPTITAPTLSNKVLLQLWDIALVANLPQRKAVDWLLDLYPDIGQKPERLRSMMVTVHKKGTQLVAANDMAKVMDFVGTSLDFNFSSEELMKIGLNRHILLSDFGYLNAEKLGKISNKIVLELDSFQNLENLGANFAAKWMSFLCNLQLNEKEIKALNRKIKKQREEN